MTPRTAPKYDPITLWLHTALATSVVFELLLEAVMRVPAGVGLGAENWHREAFELHARFGPTVAVICVLHWLWVCLPFSRPGIAYLFPWLQRTRRAVLYREFRKLLQFELPPRAELSPLVGTVHGLGLLAITGSVVGGSVSYLGYYAGLPISRQVLHWAALELIVTSWFVWTFVVGHVFMAMRHLLENRFPPIATNKL